MADYANPSGTEMAVHGGCGTNVLTGGVVYFDDTWHYIPPRTMFLYLKP